MLSYQHGLQSDKSQSITNFQAESNVTLSFS